MKGTGKSKTAKKKYDFPPVICSRLQDLGTGKTYTTEEMGEIAASLPFQEFKIVLLEEHIS